MGDNNSRQVRKEYNAKQAGEWLGVTRVSITRYIRDGCLPAREGKSKAGRRAYFIKHADLIAFEQRAKEGQRLLVKSGRPVGSVSRKDIESLTRRLHKLRAIWERQDEAAKQGADDGAKAAA